MRKDEEVEGGEEKAVGAVDLETAKHPTRTVEVEDELDDEDLLGEATLAKLGPVHGESEDEEIDDEVVDDTIKE